MNNRNSNDKEVKDVQEMKDSRTQNKKPFKKNNKRRGSKNKKENSANYNQAGLDEAGRNNKPGYYFVSKELAEQATQLSFNNVLGFGTVSGYQVPTIMRIDTVAGPGCTYDVQEYEATDEFTFVPTAEAYNATVNPGKAGVNTMASKLYTLMSSFTGRTASYAPQDVAMMILAIAAVAEYSEAIRRIFGLALTYNYWNRTLAYGLLRSMKIDVDDFFSRLSTLRMEFNKAISRINQIPLLDNIAFIEKSREIYQKVFYDDPTNMSQIFYYMPKTWAYLDEETDESGSVLRHVNHAQSSADNVTVTVGEMIDNLNLMITKVLESSTLNFIYADLLNMANKIKTPMWKFDYLAENYTVLPEYNANACLQLHNLTISGVAGTPVPNSYDPDHPEVLPKKVEMYYGIYLTEGYDVFCDANKNDIVYNPALEFTANWARHKSNLVDMLTDKPTLEDKIESLRFTSAWSGHYYKSDNTYYQIFTALPDHYAVAIVMYQNDFDNGVFAPIYSTYGKSPSLNTTPARRYHLSTQWDHAPVMKLIDVSGKKIDEVIGDLTFYTSVNFEYIQRLLNVTYIGLFEFRV